MTSVNKSKQLAKDQYCLQILLNKLKFRESNLIECYSKNIFYYFQKNQIFDSFGNRTGNLQIPSPILYQPCYGRLFLFVSFQPYLFCNILRAQGGVNAKNVDVKTETFLTFYFWRTVYIDFGCTCYILLILGMITKENKTKEGYRLREIGRIEWRENWCEFDNGSNKVSGCGFQFHRTSDSVGTVVQLNQTCKWEMSSRTRGFDNADKVSGLEISIWLGWPLWTAVEWRNVISQPTVPNSIRVRLCSRVAFPVICVASLVWGHCGTRGSQQEVVRSQGVEIRRVGANGYQWTGIETLLYQTDSC